MTTPAVLKILQPGLCTLVVDHGRPRSRSLGVPLGGAADRTALAVGNALVGNPPDAAALEVALAGPTVTADAELACVLYGAPFDLSTDRRPLVAGKTLTLQPGEVLHVGGTARGARAYLCVRGGLQTPLVLGSRSSLEPLKAGTELPCISGSVAARCLSSAWLSLWTISPRPGVQTLNILPGVQAAWFLQEPLNTGVFTVAPASNRMGLRLTGVPLSVPRREFVSEPVCPGTIQVTRDGQLIILGVDAQTIGGYPKIAQVCAWQLDTLGQLRPGDRLIFRQVELENAEIQFRHMQGALWQWLAWVRAAAIADAGRES